VVDLDALDARGRRPLAQRALESLDRLGVAFGLHFDAAIGQIPRPAVNALACRDGFGEPPEADALYSPANQKTSGYSQSAMITEAEP